MKKTYLLALIFFAGLAALWWLEYAQIPREEERLARMHRVLRDLFDVRVREIQKIEIRRQDQPLSFERREGSRWQMVKPIDAAADPAFVENLIQNLIDLTRSPDVGTITESGQAYGLEPPLAIIRVQGERAAQSTHGSEIDAALEIGKSQQEVRFVRPRGEKGIDVVDAKLLSALDAPLADWREKALLPVPTFQVAALSIQGPASAYEAARNRAGHWTLRDPVHVPANGIKIENLLAGLSSLRVADGSEGFVANDARDLGPFGLDRPELTVTLKTTGPQDRPMVLQFGKPAPNKPDRVYAKRGDQDDVVLVNAKILAEIPRNAKDLRTGQVTDFEPGRVARIEIEAPFLGNGLILDRTATGWKRNEPADEAVDVTSIQDLLKALHGLQSSELFDVNGPDDPRLTPLSMTIKLWQQQASPQSSGDPPLESQPALSLRIGRHDVLRKTVYGRLEGDSFVLAIPDMLVKVLPKNAFAFRDRTVLALNPGLIKSLRIGREGQTYEAVPSTTSGPANEWKLIAPVQARADMTTLSQIFASLAQLRAEEFVADAKNEGQDARFGLDRPVIEVAWEIESRAKQSSSDRSETAGRLRIGSRVGRTPSYYAKLDHLPIIFTLDAATVGGFENELHDRTVLSFAADRAAKVVLRWPNRAVTLIRKPDSQGASPTWIADAESNASGVDAAQIGPLLAQMAGLQAIRFLQYRGILPVMTGLATPRLTIEVYLAGDPTPRILRIGNTREGGFVYAAEGKGDSGPVFFLPAMAWNHLIDSGKPEEKLPDDVFAPPDSPSSNRP